MQSCCALSALVDSEECYDAPQCLDSTRWLILRKLQDWADADDNMSASIFWLKGGAGAGKSALAQTFAERFKKNGKLAATFFFFRTDKLRNDGKKLILTIILQLAESFPDLRPPIEDNIRTNSLLFSKNRETQVLELLLEPLHRLSLHDTAMSMSSRPRLIVIDGVSHRWIIIIIMQMISPF